MERIESFERLIESQDILRKVYCKETNSQLRDLMSSLDKQFSNLINTVGFVCPYSAK